MVDVIVMFVSGIIGYILLNRGYTMSPVALSLLLGSMLEQNLQLTRSQYSNFLMIFTRPMTVIFFALAFFSFAFPFIRKAAKKAG
jgi:putative tricarboxylic transport membrane protein